MVRSFRASEIACSALSFLVPLRRRESKRSSSSSEQRFYATYMYSISNEIKRIRVDILRKQPL